MYLQELHCEHFRRIARATVPLERGVNVLCGNNAQGKTTFLEAVHFLATARSHRTNIETELVTEGEEGFSLQAAVQRSDRTLDIDLRWWNGIKRFRINGVLQQRVSDILGKLSIVLASPEDVALVRGGAAARRKFLDMELSQLQPRYLNALQRYRQALRQRNELLRDGKTAPGLIEPWDEQLISHGGYLIRERRAFVEQLGALAAQAHRCIASGERLQLTYRPSVEDQTDFREALSRSREIDFRRGATSRGPHRDDLDLVVADRHARRFASQGQLKTVAIALKLAEMNLIKARTKEWPILMLDEVFAELDTCRARQLFDAVAPDVQCILTTTDAFETLDIPDREYTCFVVKEGDIARR